jgi:hypothetical protein
VVLRVGHCRCWTGLKSHFDRDWYKKQQQQQEMQQTGSGGSVGQNGPS